MMDTHEIGGAALVVGYAALLAVLYQDPTTGIAAATAEPTALLYFLVVPVAGLLAGAYAYADGPFAVVPLFALGSYMGVVGVLVTFGSLLSPTPVGVVLGVGILLVVLSVATLVASVVRSTEALGLGAVLSRPE